MVWLSSFRVDMGGNVEFIGDFQGLSEKVMMIGSVHYNSTLYPTIIEVIE